MLPCYEQRVNYSRMGTPYSNGTTFPPENGEVRTLFVSGLPMDVRLRELYLLFRGFEPIVSHNCKGIARSDVTRKVYDEHQWLSKETGYEGSFLKLISSKPGKPPQPIAFVSFKTRNQAEKALEELQGIRFDPAVSQTLRLEFARTNSRVSPRQPQSGSSTSSAGYYNSFTPAKNGTYAYYFVPNTSAAMAHHSVHGMIGMAPDSWSPRMPMSMAYPSMPHLSSPSPTFSSAPSTPHLSVLNILSDSDSSPTPSPTPDMAPSLGNGQFNAMPCSTLFVANLELQHTEEEIGQLFNSCRDFVRVKMFSRGGPPVAFAEFKDVDSATEAMEKLQGYVLMSSKRSSGIRIEYAKQRMGEPQPRSPSINGSSNASSPVQNIIASHIPSEPQTPSSCTSDTPSPLAAEFTPQHPSTIIGTRGFSTPRPAASMVYSSTLNPQAPLFMNGLPSPIIPSQSWPVKPSS